MFPKGFFKKGGTMRGVCRLCPCEAMDPEVGCPRRLHQPHAMEELGDTGVFFCPTHDVPPKGSAASYWAEIRDPWKLDSPYDPAWETE